jgi:hypothetical protein
MSLSDVHLLMEHWKASNVQLPKHNWSRGRFNHRTEFLALKLRIVFFRITISQEHRCASRIRSLMSIDIGRSQIDSAVESEQSSDEVKSLMPTRTLQIFRDDSKLSRVTTASVDLPNAQVRERRYIP